MIREPCNRSSFPSSIKPSLARFLRRVRELSMHSVVARRETLARRYSISLDFENRKTFNSGVISGGDEYTSDFNEEAHRPLVSQSRLMAPVVQSKEEKDMISFPTIVVDRSLS